MSINVGFFIKITAAIFAGMLSGHAAVYLFNKMPAKWLCDYGQEPEEELKNLSSQRVKGYPWKWVFSGFFAAALIRLVLFDWPFAIAALVFCWALLEAALADKKYGIIPDQMVILAAISALGFIPSHQDMWQPLWGTLLGGGVMLASGVLGRIFTKKGVPGHGRCKAICSYRSLPGAKGNPDCPGFIGNQQRTDFFLSPYGEKSKAG